MSTHSFKAAYNTGESQVNLVLGVYIFTEEKTYIAYYPALDRISPKIRLRKLSYNKQPTIIG